MTSNPKANPVSPDDLIFDELDEANKKNYYKAVQKEIKQTCKEVDANGEQLVEQEMGKYIESFRNYYYATQILSNSKSNQFFEEIVRELHPNIKLKGPAKNILKIACKVFVQELAETCLEVGNLTNRSDIDVDLIEDANRLMQKRRTRKNNVGQLFNQMQY